MKTKFFISIAVLAIFILSGCGKAGKSKGLPNDGQLHGVAPLSHYTLPKPPGMVYIPPGTFHMGPSDEDINYAFTARNKQVSISGFWMDATEITNNEYRQFTNWVRDSISGTLMGYVKQGTDGNQYLDWKKIATIKWNDKATMEKIDAIIVTPDNRIFGRKEIDPLKIVYHS
ncbi:MAG: SUMF1/EgtB/PvdO family nonheme iron enzyme, partial [Ginsengibacter sp.]